MQAGNGWLNILPEILPRKMPLPPSQCWMVVSFWTVEYYATLRLSLVVKKKKNKTDIAKTVEFAYESEVHDVWKWLMWWIRVQNLINDSEKWCLRGQNVLFELSELLSHHECVLYFKYSRILLCVSSLMYALHAQRIYWVSFFMNMCVREPQLVAVFFIKSVYFWQSPNEHTCVCTTDGVFHHECVFTIGFTLVRLAWVFEQQLACFIMSVYLRPS